jgi:outer membrane lipoprotein-sorting protein
MTRAGTLALAWITALAMARADAAAIPANPQQDARSIMIDRDRQRPKSEEYVGEVTVISKDGKERRKVWRSYRTGPPGASDRLIRFLSPPDVRGVGFLAHYRHGKDPEEWLYLPSMKRERRVGARDREGAFVGTNLSYDDLDLLEFDETRYAASLLPSQVVGGVPVHVIELTAHKPSAYGRKVITLRKTDFNLLTIEYFVAGNRAPVKRLTRSDFADVGGYSIARRMEIVDLRQGGRTVILLHDIMVDRPQPRDRYTIQNLRREDDITEGSPRSPRLLLPAHMPGSGGLIEPRVSRPGAQTSTLRLPSGFSGHAEIKGFAQSSSTTSWATVFVRETARIGQARIAGALRFEASSSPHVGPIVFDPADRDPLRSPISIRELSLVVPLGAGLDLQVGRFHVSWGETDGYSPADAFLPRDLSDPLTEERLPLWAAALRGEKGAVRVEVVVAPTTTPWRLPLLGGRQSPFASISSINVRLVEHPWTVPHAGFEAARVTATAGNWDIGAWVRTGIRPAPVLDPKFDALDLSRSGSTAAAPVEVPLDRHFATEHAGGGSLSRVYRGWIVRTEAGVFRSSDPLLGNASIWSIGGSRVVRNGTFTATVAMNLTDPPVNPLLLFDRALVPCVILGVREYKSWGNWTAGWLGTFRTVGGVLTADVTKDLTDVVKITAGADLPHGAVLSPASAFSGGQRIRAALRWSW